MPPTTPANHVEVFEVTVPAGTPIASPTTADLDLPLADVLGVDIVIPDGHAGLTGIQLLLSGGPALPSVAGTYFRGNDETIAMTLTDQLDAGSWSAAVYNLDSFDHTFDVRFYLNTLSIFAESAQPQPLPSPIIA